MTEATEPLVPQESAALALSYLDGLLPDMIARANAALAKFRTDLEKSPADALAWSEGVFEAAARHCVANEVTRIIASHRAKGHTAARIVATVRAHLTKKVMFGAGHPHRSTSPASNEMSQQMTGAMARLLESLEFAE